jgi:hypothetical protein
MFPHQPVGTSKAGRIDVSSTGTSETFCQVPETSKGNAGIIEGRLIGGYSPGPEHVDCAWLDTSGGRKELFYPDGWNVLFDPLRITNSQGQVVAREGDLLRATVSEGGIGGSLCTTGSPLRATSVEVVEPGSAAPTRSGP